MPITPTRSLPSQVIEVGVTETEGEEGRELEKEIAFLSLVADGPRKEPIHRLQAVTLKRVDPFTPNHAIADSFYLIWGSNGLAIPNSNGLSPPRGNKRQKQPFLRSEEVGSSNFLIPTSKINGLEFRL